jgi:hypothetical protein
MSDLLHKKIGVFIILALGTAWQFRYLPSLVGNVRWMSLVVLFLFDAIGIVLSTFAAVIQPERDGISVEQFGTYHLSFEDVLKCATVPFFPQTFVLVRTNQRFPVNILFCEITLNVKFGGEVETVKLVDFLRSRNSRLVTGVSREKGISET